MIDESVRARAMLGAALLDERSPGWDQEIDLTELDLRDECHCILGQLFDEYERGVAGLDLDYPDEADFGFLLRWPHRSESDWGDLTTAWRELIAARRLEASRD